MREFISGVGDLARGFRFWITSPRLMLLGAIPALIVAVVWAALLIWLIGSLDAVATAITPFAADWSPTWRGIVRFGAGAAVLVAAVLVAALSFAAVTLAVGGPFYDRIGEEVERRLGDPPPDDDGGLLRGMWRGIVDGARLLVASIGVGLLAFAVGLIPLAGAPLAIVVGAVLGGRLLTVELTATAFDARGHDPAQRRRILDGRRATVLGFGAAVWLLLLVPLVAVVAMPAAKCGATVLARRVLEGERPRDQPTT